MRVYVGYDAREDIAYQVCRYSILKHSPTSTVRPIVMERARADRIYTRGPDIFASTTFATTRYLVPFFAKYTGYALYMDCDMLVTEDIDGIWQDIKTGYYPVVVVKHEFVPRREVKMLGNKQIFYPRKGWSSLMLIDCGSIEAKRLTPGLINTADISYLNELKWAEDNIGALPSRWNHLVRHDLTPKELPAVIHWTYGGCWLEDQPKQLYDDLWLQYRKEMER